MILALALQCILVRFISCCLSCDLRSVTTAVCSNGNGTLSMVYQG